MLLLYWVSPFLLIPSILSESLQTSELTSTFLEACVCQTLSMGDLWPWGGIFQPRSRTGLVYDRVGAEFSEAHNLGTCLRFEAPVLGCYMLPLWGSSGAAPPLLFPFTFFDFLSPDTFLSQTFKSPFCTIFPTDLLPLECLEIPAFLHLFYLCSQLLPQPLSLLAYSPKFL